MRGLDDEHPGEPWLHGVAARRELLAAGIGEDTIDHRIRTGRYLRLYDGVYAIGHADLTVAGRRRAIVLACGPTAVLSHRSAAGAWGLRPDGAARWDVTVRKASKVQPDAPVRVYRHPTLRDDEITTLDGVPITTVARTLLDLAALLRPHHLRRALEEAEHRHLFDLTAISRTLRRHPRRPGRRQLVSLVDELSHQAGRRTRSDVEALFLQLCADHGLPRPQVNITNNGAERDFTFAEHGLVVEVDGYTFHSSRRAFQRDRARDRQALREGIRVARFTAHEVVTDPTGVAAELRALLKLK
jgi:very-short-patch-repair endonuclease